MEIKEMRLKTGMTQTAFAKYLNIPHRSVQSWELGERKCPDYLKELIEYKLRNEKLIRE